jgi:competence protein ComEC
MRLPPRRLVALAVALAGAGSAGVGQAAATRRPLDVYWIDVEGGAATLVVTPAGESILIDAGFSGDRDSRRIHRAATEAAGLKRIDHVILTHFHGDHFGGIADLARLLPLGTLHERDLEQAPEAERTDPALGPYKAAAVERRMRLAAGDTLELKQAPGAAPVAVRILGADERYVPARAAADNPVCRDRTSMARDETDNRNSVVTLVRLGPFRFFDGGDLSWAGESDLVCPRDRVGPVDVMQTDHHGSDTSGNPVLFRTLRPTVAVMNNGARKGGNRSNFESLRASGIGTLYQVHRSLNAPDDNTAAERIANAEEDCAGIFIKMSVDPLGRSYTMWVPSTGHRARYTTRQP